MLNEAQDYEAAIKELEAAVGAAPEFTLAHLNLGNAYRGRPDVAKALQEYQLVLRSRPDLADVYFNLAVLHLDQEVAGVDTVERFKTAISYFNQYKDKGGKDERVAQYIKDATKGIEKEERRRERDKKDQLKKAKAAEDAAKKAAEEAAKPAPAPEPAKPADAAPAPTPPPAGGKVSGDEK